MEVLDGDRASLPTVAGEAAVRRLDLQNASVYDRAARLQLCGFLDLRVGRVCCLPVHHRGGCLFVLRDELERHPGNPDLPAV